MGCCSNNEHIAVIINIYIYNVCILYRNIRVILQGVVIVRGKWWGGKVEWDGQCQWVDYMGQRGVGIM